MAPRLSPAVLLFLTLLAGPTAAGAQTLRPLAEGSVPLILKDGRIAEVSIYAVPFLTASSEMPDEVEEELRALIADFATDCFLTAQVIGHVEPGPDKDGGTLAAHRLARARAERIQALMTERGLPAQSIASVWDWQFSTPESRATVWFFALDPEEGCADAPLVAAGPESGAPTPGTAAPTSEAERRDREAEDAAGTVSPPGETEPLTVVVRRPATEDRLPGSPRPEAAPAGEETAAGTVPVEPAEAPGETPIPPPEGTAAAAPGPASDERPASVAEAATDADGKAPQGLPEKLLAEETPGEIEPRLSASALTVAADPGGTGEPRLEIVFDLNSSWLPHGAVKDLGALLERLREGRYALEIVTAVDNGPIKNGTPEDAARYNRWLAERRANRVAEWLRRRGDGVIVDIEQRFREDDPSRKVVIRARRLP